MTDKQTLHKNRTFNSAKRMVRENPWITWDVDMYVIYLQHYCECRYRMKISECSKHSREIAHIDYDRNNTNNLF